MYQDKENNELSFTEKPETQRFSYSVVSATSYAESAMETASGASKPDGRRKKLEQLN